MNPRIILAVMVLGAMSMAGLWGQEAEKSEAVPSGVRIIASCSGYLYTDFVNYIELPTQVGAEVQLPILARQFDRGMAFTLRASFGIGWQSNDTMGIGMYYADASVLTILPPADFNLLLWPLTVPLTTGLEAGFTLCTWFEVLASLRGGVFLLIYPEGTPKLGLDALATIGCNFMITPWFGLRLEAGYSLYGIQPDWLGPVVSIGAVFGL